jgi:hypothetical protein
MSARSTGLLLLFFFAWIFALNALRIVVLIDLWAWFAAPLGAPLLSFWRAAGLQMLFVLIHPPPMAKDADSERARKEPWRVAWNAAFHGLAVTLVPWGIGWLVMEANR